MKRRFNYTGRKRIPTHLVDVALHSGENVRTFDLRLADFKALGLPDDAKVYVEPYVKSSSMRFAFGTVGSIVPPDDRSLTEIDEGGSILFRILVVDEKDSIGRLLAMGDRIAPRGEEEQREALLPLVTEDLGEGVWRLDDTLGVAPRLLINNRFPGLKQKLLDDPLLMGAILPIAVRDALRAMSREQEDECDWIQKWRKFVQQVAGEECAEAIFDQGEEDDDKVDDAIERLCDLLKDRRRYLSRSLVYFGAIADA